MAVEQERHDGFFKQVSAITASVYAAVMEGGQIQAFLRQGVAELGSALKAFPDSIQIDEPGAVFNPLYADLVADKRAAESAAPALGRLMSPGEIAGGMTPGPANSDTQQLSRQPLPSPGEIARDQQPYQSQQDQGQEQSQSHGRGM